jgi:ribokinase
MLNAAPFRRDFPWGKVSIDYLVVNEHEAAELLGKSPGASLSVWAKRVRPRLMALRVQHLIVTRGAEKTYYVGARQSFAVPVARVRPIDTVGAGDAFTGTLAAHLTSGMPLGEALVFANCAGALATQAVGAQEALPSVAETRRLARRYLCMRG